MIAERIVNWINIEDNDRIKLLFNWGFKLTGRWRLGGEGKPYDIVNPEL